MALEIMLIPVWKESATLVSTEKATKFDMERFQGK